MRNPSWRTLDCFGLTRGLTILAEKAEPFHTCCYNLPTFTPIQQSWFINLMDFFFFPIWLSAHAFSKCRAINTVWTFRGKQQQQQQSKQFHKHKANWSVHPGSSPAPSCTSFYRSSAWVDALSYASGVMAFLVPCRWRAMCARSQAALAVIKHTLNQDTSPPCSSAPSAPARASAISAWQAVGKQMSFKSRQPTPASGPVVAGEV